MERTRKFRLTSFVAVIVVISVLVWHTTPTAPRPIAAQEVSCPDFVNRALATASKLCDATTKRNQACYGNTLASAQARPGATIKFTTPGDIAELGDLQGITLTGYDANAGTWGIAMMRIQANLPDTGVGQNVTVLVFGDTQLQNASSGKPMQAFYFRTGVGAPGCHEMPQDGVLLKTPAGSQKVQLVANGVQLSVGSTVFLQAKSTRPLPGVLSATSIAATPAGTKGATAGTLFVHTLKGSVDVTSNGKTQTVDAGMETSVDFDEDWQPVSEPDAPETDTFSVDEQTIEVLDQADVSGEATAQPEEIGTPGNEPGQESATVEPGNEEPATVEPGQEPTVEPGGAEQPTPEPGGNPGGSGG